MNLLMLSTGYTRSMPDPAGVRIAEAISLDTCQHENTIEEVFDDLREVLTICQDCQAVYNAGEGIWYEA